MKSTSVQIRSHCVPIRHGRARPGHPCTPLQVLLMDGRHRAGHDGWSLCVRCADSLTSTSHRRAKHDIWYFGERRGIPPAVFAEQNEQFHGASHAVVLRPASNTYPQASARGRRGEGGRFPENESMWCAMGNAPDIGMGGGDSRVPPSRFPEVRMGTFGSELYVKEDETCW
jgi:hypothetical protein